MPGIALLLLPLVLLAMACGRPKDDADFRAFAAQIEDAIERRDGEFFGRRAETSVLECPNRQLPFCDLLDPGDDVRVFPVRTAIEGTIIPIADYIGLITYWTASADAALKDDYGDGTPVLYALARSRPAAGAPEEMHAIVTAIPTPPWGNNQRATRIITWRYEDERWLVVYDTLLDTATSPLAMDAWLTGECDACFESWERWQPPSH